MKTQRTEINQQALLFIIQLSHNGSPAYVLLGRHTRGPFIGKLSGVGGKVEKDQTVIQSLVSETWDESKLIIREDDLVKMGEILVTRTISLGVSLVFKLHVFFSFVHSGILHDTSEMVEWNWHPIHNIPWWAMASSDKAWLTSILVENKKIQGTLTLGPPPESLVLNFQSKIVLNF